MRILIGICEIANNISTIQESLLLDGHQVESVVLRKFIEENKYYKSNFYNYKVGISLKCKPIQNLVTRILLASFFFRSIFKYDIFYYVWHFTFLPLKLDLFILRLIGKQVIIMNCGDDVRYRPIQWKLDKYCLNFRSVNKDEEKNYINSGASFTRTFFNQWLEEKSGASILSLRNQSTFQNKALIIFRFPTPQIINWSKEATPKPLVIHAPTNRGLKGTQIALDSIQLLKNDNIKFDFELIENESNSYVLQRLKEAEIVIDQPSTWTGRFAVEALAAGCVVIGGNRPDYVGIENDSPVIQFESDPQYLYSTLKKCILDIGLRQQIMEESYRYWRNTYSPQSFNKYFYRVLDGTSPKYLPIRDHKKKILKYCENSWQRFIVKIFM